MEGEVKKIVFQKPAEDCRQEAAEDCRQEVVEDCRQEAAAERDAAIRQELGNAGAECRYSAELEELMKNRITPESDIPKMEFLFEWYGQKCFPRRELVVVSGKAKSGKTTFLALLMAAGVKVRPKAGAEGGIVAGAEGGMVADCEADQSPLRRTDEQPLRVMWYDTEQSQQSTQEILTSRICGDIYAFNVRTYRWKKRLEMFKAALPYLDPDLVVLDGVRDLLADINDANEAQEMTNMLMTMAQELRCCIVCVLHQNKSEGDHTLRGWIGTELTNKVFETYCCEKLTDGTLSVRQDRSRKCSIDRELFYTIDPDTQRPVFSSEAKKEQPTAEQPSNVQQHCSDSAKELTELFKLIMEGKTERPKREMMAIAMRKCNFSDKHIYYKKFDKAEELGIIRQSKHPNTGEDWVELIEGQLSF